MHTQADLCLQTEHHRVLIAIQHPVIRPWRFVFETIMRKIEIDHSSCRDILMFEPLENVKSYNVFEITKTANQTGWIYSISCLKFEWSGRFSVRFLMRDLLFQTSR